jgi:hypothetical protein
MITPSVWSRSSDDSPNPKDVPTDMFTEVWQRMDMYVDMRFLKLEKFALYVPWTTYEDVLGMLPKCRHKGIVERAPYGT